MSNLKNGDSKTIVKLLSEKIDDNGKQYNQRLDDFQKSMEKEYGGLRGDVDNHCVRIRGLEKHKNTIGGIMIIMAIIITAALNYLIKVV